MTATRLRKGVVAVLMALSALSLVGCGGSDSGASNSGGSGRGLGGGPGGGPGGGSFPAGLVGEWDRGGATTAGTYDAASGTWSMPGGAGTAYHFNADGTFSFAGLLIAGGGCSLSAFVWRQGNAAVSGSQLTLTDTVNQVDTGDCASGTTQPQGLGTETLGWALDASGTQLSLTDPDPNIGTLTYAKQ